MKSEKILHRLEEIEAELGYDPTDHHPIPDTINTGQLRRLCQDMRELMAQNAVMREALQAAFREIERVLNEYTCDGAGERARLPVEMRILKALKPDAGQALLDRFHKLEAVAEAKRFQVLEEALAALERRNE